MLLLRCECANCATRICERIDGIDGSTNCPACKSQLSVPEGTARLEFWSPLHPWADLSWTRRIVVHENRLEFPVAWRQHWFAGLWLGIALLITTLVLVVTLSAAALAVGVAVVVCLCLGAGYVTSRSAGPLIIEKERNSVLVHRDRHGSRVSDADVRAVQSLRASFGNDSHDTEGPYWCYELNLVSENDERLNLLATGPNMSWRSPTDFRRFGRQVADFLEVPLLEGSVACNPRYPSPETTWWVDDDRWFQAG